MPRALQLIAFHLALASTACRADAPVGNPLDARAHDAALDLPPRPRFVVPAGGPGADVARALALDREGNIVIAGSFQGTARFGTIALIATHAYESFVAKLDPRGTFIWARTIAGTLSGDRPQGLALDAAGNVHVAVSFTGRATLDGATVETSSQTDILIAKLDAAGRRVWHVPATRTNPIGLEEGLGIGVDAGGRITVAGTFDHGAAVFGKISIDAEGERSAIFVARLDAEGRFIWAKPAGEPGGAGASALAVDPEGSFYLAGSFGRYTRIGRFGAHELRGEGGFVAKADPSGTFVWAKPVTFDASSGCFGIALLPGSAQLLVTGTDRQDIARLPFVAALSVADGSTGWTQSDFPPGTSGSRGTGIAGSLDGRSALTGQIVHAGADAFVARLDPSGKILATQSIDGSNDDVGHAIALDAAGNAYVAGSFTGSASFDGEKVTATGKTDAFIWKVPP
jgi:hypothetical protein